MYLSLQAYACFTQPCFSQHLTNSTILFPHEQLCDNLDEKMAIFRHEASYTV